MKATWVGPGGYELPDKTPLVPGETVVDISEGEANASDNWEPVKAAPKPAKGDE